MTKGKKKIHLICQKCAELNGGKWRPNNLMVNLSLGPCQVCKIILPIVQVLHWKGLSVTKDFMSSYLGPVPALKHKALAKKEVSSKVRQSDLFINNDLLT